MRNNTLVSLSEVIEKLFKNANGVGIKYCILRNYQELPESTLGGDIDLLIHPDDKIAWVKHMQGVVSFFGLDLGVIQSHYHGVRYCIFNIKKSIFIKLDVHYGEYWRGVSYFSADQMLNGLKKHNGFFIPGVVNESVLTLLDPLITGGSPRSKYKDVVTQSVRNHRKEFLERLSGIVGSHMANKVVAYIDNDKYMNISSLTDRIRINLWFRMFFKSYGKDLLDVYRYFVYEFRRRRIKRLGYLIVIDGEECEVKNFIKIFSDITDRDFSGIDINSEYSYKINNDFSNARLRISQLLQSFNIVLCSHCYLKENSIYKKKSKFLDLQKFITILKDKVVIDGKEISFNEAVHEIYIDVMSRYIKNFKEIKSFK